MFDGLNFRIGRRELIFECAKPTWGDNDQLSLRGVVSFGDTREDACVIAQMMERELREMQKSQELLPVVHDDYSEVSGYYTLLDFDMVPFEVYFLEEPSNTPAHPVTFRLQRIGSANDVRLQSLIEGTVQINDYSIVEAGAEPVHAPPLGHVGYTPRHATTITRLVAYDDPITVYRDIDFDIDPKWGSDPSDYYRGAAYIARRDPLYPQYGPISGKSNYEVNVEDVEIGNDIVKFWATETGAAWAFWDGAWREKTVAFGIGGVAVPGFENVTFLRNDGERCSVRYDHNETGGGLTRLEVSAVRGERGLRCRLQRDISSVLAVASGVASTNTSNRLLQTTADANGHKILLVTMKTAIFTGASGTIEKTALTLDFYLSVELSGAGTGNQAAQLGAQYAAAVSEHVRVVRR